MRGTILCTERLRLPPFRPDDVDEALHYRNDAASARFLPHIPHPFARADATQFVTTHMEELWEMFPMFAIELEDRLIGTVNLEVDTDNQIAMLGYAISRDRWGEGIAYEAARAVIAWGFQTFNLAKIWASTDARHHRSHRVLGMQHEGTPRARPGPGWQADGSGDLRATPLGMGRDGTSAVRWHNLTHCPAPPFARWMRARTDTVMTLRVS